MYVPLFEKLHVEGKITDASLQKIKEHPSVRLLSVHWELKILLYLGVLLLSGGLGILVYKNIDTIGHQMILLFIALLCGAGFFYCSRHKAPFTVLKAVSPNVFFDYALLLSCLLMLIFVAYLQFQYRVFGNRYGLATFFPMLVLFFAAYYYDHLGVLSLAITNLGTWLGITVTPLHIWQSADMSSSTVIFTGLFLGVLLVAASIVTRSRDFKKHFAFTYLNFGMHLLFISCLAAMFDFENGYLLWLVVLAGMVYYFYAKAHADRSFYIMMVTTLYSYIGLGYVVVRLLDSVPYSGIGLVYFGLIYFIVSGLALVFFLIRMNKKLKSHDRLS